MIKYFKNRRKREMLEVYKELMEATKQLHNEGRDDYKVDMENVNTTTDIIKVLEITTSKAVFKLTPEEKAKTDKYLIKVK